MKICCFDGDSLYRRYVEGTDGKSVGAAFAATLERIRTLSDGFDRIVVAFDSGGSFRTALWPSYKAGRKRLDPAAAEQRERLRAHLVALGATVLGAPAHPGHAGLYFEADDVIATVAWWATLKGHQVQIVSADKDLLQLVSDAEGVWVYNHAKNEVRREVEVVAGLSVEPRRVVDLLAIGGDTSDNFKPFPGVAQESAAKLVNAYGTAAAAMIAVLSATAEEPLKVKLTAPQIESLRAGGVVALDKGLALAKLYAVPGLALDAIEAEPVMAPVPSDAPVYGVHHAPHAEQRTSQPPEVHADPVKPVAPPVRHAPVQGPSTALARVELEPLAIQPHSMPEVYDFALCAFNSRCYTQFGNVEQVMMCILEARERRVPVGAALRSAYIVKGKLAWSASFLASLVINSGKAEIFEIIESTDQRAVLEYKRVGRPARTFEFTIAEAQRAGWLKSGERGDSKWITNPRTMLRWAAIREAARAFFPDVVSGMYTPDELRGEGRVLDGELEEAA